MKLSLQSPRDLKLFCSLVIPVKGEPMKEWTLAYAGEEVLNDLKMKYANNPSVINLIADILVKDLLVNLDLEETKSAETIPITKESFINNLKLVMDRFVESENDRKSIIRILGKIK